MFPISPFQISRSCKVKIAARTTWSFEASERFVETRRDEIPEKSLAQG